MPVVDGHGLGFDDEPRRVAVSVDGTLVADSTATITLLETGLPPRHYFPQADVRMDLLEATPTETVCPFKGQARYWTLRIGDAEHRDLAWGYDTPIDGVERLAGLVCFYDERVEVAIDGETQPRPETPWSRQS